MSKGRIKTSLFIEHEDGSRDKYHIKVSNLSLFEVFRFVELMESLDLNKESMARFKGHLYDKAS